MAKKMKITPAIVKEHGLSEDEYQIILDRLGREPNINELGIFSVMWSEHCSYKSSRRHLGKFLTTGDKVIQGPGEKYWRIWKLCWRADRGRRDKFSQRL